MIPSGNAYLPSLIVLPTRELAKQVADQVNKLIKSTGLRMSLLIGGLSLIKHFRYLDNRPDIVIATPGRLWKCIESGHPYLANLYQLKFLVIDEADRMLSAGHYSELLKILEFIDAVPEDITVGKRQTLVFSATLANDAFDIKKVDDLKQKLNMRENTKIVDLSKDEESKSLFQGVGKIETLFDRKPANIYRW